MTRKKAIKTIMSVTGHGDKRAANKAFDNVKKCLAGNPRNADVCYRVICFIYNAANSDPDGPDVHAYNAGMGVSKAPAPALRLPRGRYADWRRGGVNP